jgi:Protein of unknown function (DUF3027)
MEHPLNNLIGLYCLEAYSGFGGHLKIKCSKFPDTVSLIFNDLAEPEWHFEAISSGWRLNENSEILTGSYQEEEHTDMNLKVLIGKKIITVSANNVTDFTILFEDNFQIDTFNQGLDFPPLTFYNAIEMSRLTMNPFGKWSSEKIMQPLTEEERLEEEHAEHTQKRWKEWVPKKAFDNHCEECAFFLPTSGRFYSWEFGICTNEKSIHDAKLVGTKSTCENFLYDFKGDDD